MHLRLIYVTLVGVAQTDTRRITKRLAWGGGEAREEAPWRDNPPKRFAQGTESREAISRLQCKICFIKKGVDLKRFWERYKHYARTA